METFTEDTFEFRKARIVGGDEGAGVGVMGVLRGLDGSGNRQQSGWCHYLYSILTHFLVFNLSRFSFYINSEYSDFSGDSFQSYDSDMSPENINRPFHSENGHDCSDFEETENRTRRKPLPYFSFFGKRVLNVKFRKSTRFFQAVYYPRNIWSYKQKHQSIHIFG